MQFARFVLLASMLGSCAEDGRAPQAQEQPGAAVPSEASAPSNAAEPAAGGSTQAKAATPAQTSPCFVQDGKAVEAARLRALGTEPFWAARIEGRCVTYMTPEDQAGTRVWTRYSHQERSWTGALAGKPFVLRIRPQANCSDGMSDNVYPFAAQLTVNGEERTGCAEPGGTGR